MNAVWVLVTEENGAPSALGLELVTLARSLGEPTVLYVGNGSVAAWETLAEYGAAKVFHFSPGDRLPASPIAASIDRLIGEHSPDLVLFGQSYTDRDIAGRLAARLGASILTNTVAVSLDPGLVTTHEIFGGSQLAKATISGQRPFLVGIRPKSYPAEPAPGPAPAIAPVELEETTDSGAMVVSRHSEERAGPQLEEAAVVVSGGRGLGKPEAFDLVEAVAKPLRAATGATRAIVDAGWVPYAKQVGQTGKTVKPDVYIACGISGAMQHMVGMKDARTIIAINRDPDAPIFSVADLGVVGDVHQVLPKLIDELEQRT